jgi:hypothetical protein
MHDRLQEPRRRRTVDRLVVEGKIQIIVWSTSRVMSRSTASDLFLDGTDQVHGAVHAPQKRGVVWNVRTPVAASVAVSVEVATMMLAASRWRDGSALYPDSRMAELADGGAEG